MANGTSQNEVLNLTTIRLSLGQALFIIGISLSVAGTLAASLVQLHQVIQIVQDHSARLNTLESQRAYDRGKAGLPEDRR